jgi:hypothetical protein
LLEGPAKKKSRGARAFAKSQTNPPTIRLFFSLICFLVRFWAFLGNGSSKTPQKVHVGKYFQNFDKNSMSVFPRHFLFYRVFGFFSAMGVQKHYKNRFEKNRVAKNTIKKTSKKQI